MTASSKVSITWTRCLVLIILASVSTQGFLQEVILYENLEETGNIFTFRSNVPDTSAYTLIGNVQRMCTRGIWYFFDELNFEGRSSSVWGYHDNLYCSNLTFGPFDYKSFRHFGSIETSEDSLNLYSKRDFVGEELVIRDEITAGISSPIGSLSLTGSSNWTLFEGIRFNGSSECRFGVTGDQSFEYQYTLGDLTTVGSVLKGCV